MKAHTTYKERDGHARGCQTLRRQLSTQEKKKAGPERMGKSDSLFW
jgi:hypothetical protein